MKLIELFAARNSITESKEMMFKVQQRDDSHSKWEDLADELYTKEEAQEFLDTSDSDDFRVEERAISTDGKVILRPTPKNKKTKDVLARNASPEVHKRNKDFFDKHL